MTNESDDRRKSVETMREYNTLIHTIDGCDGGRRAMSRHNAVRACDESEAAHAAVGAYIETLDDANARADGIGPGARVMVDVFLDQPTAEGRGMSSEHWHVAILVDAKSPTLH